MFRRTVVFTDPKYPNVKAEFRKTNVGVFVFIQSPIGKIRKDDPVADYEQAMIAARPLMEFEQERYSIYIIKKLVKEQNNEQQ